jgi:CcmD family protein
MNTEMNHQHLQLAYLATWIILIAYVVFLTLKARRLKREGEELEKGRK